jgi:tripartite-type tricarboxylate transporter receptor subunit TctC
MRFSIPTVVASIYSALLSFPSNAQDWPSRPVTMVIPFAAGSGTDVIARIFAKRLSELLAGQVIVENIGGAGGMTAANHVAKSLPDGYRVLFGTSSTHAVSQTLQEAAL